MLLWLCALGTLEAEDGSFNGEVNPPQKKIQISLSSMTEAPINHQPNHRICIGDKKYRLSVKRSKKISLFYDNICKTIINNNVFVRVVYFL